MVTIRAVLGIVVVALGVGVPHAGRAQGGAAADDAPLPIELKVGEVRSVCSTGGVICPARAVICDDLAVVAVVGAADGVAFQGVKPGSTLCSASSAGMIRRVFRVKVLAPR